MLRQASVFLFLTGLLIGAFAQQNDRSPGTERFTEPALLPGQTPVLAQKCSNQHREIVEFEVLINSSGFPTQYYFRTVRGNEADLIALRTVAADHFSPAKRGGVAIQVNRTVAVDMELCAEKHKESDGTKVKSLSLAAAPYQRILPPADMSAGELEIQSPIPDTARTYRIGGSISQPTPLLTPEAHFTDQARKAHKQGICLVRLVVDAHGAPENVHVVQPLGMGLDEEAVNAVQRYRFRPAMKNEQIAVPVLITIEVKFRLG